VLAVGSPFGFDSTFTAGIVSAKGRSGRNLSALAPNPYQEFIQTDAAINPGNSGGPLINLEGEVVGLNNQIATRTGGSVGIGFAIPSRLAEPVMQMLVQSGRAERSWFGVELKTLKHEQAHRLGVSRGVLVTSVVPDSPADEAGLVPGDVIVSFAGEHSSNENELRNDIAFTPPGTRVDVGFVRDGRERQASTVLIDRLHGAALALGGEAAPSVGLVARTFTSADARQAGFDEAIGVVVLDVEPESRGDRAGLQAGDVVVGVDGEYVNDLGEFFRAINRGGDREINLWVVRNRRQGYLEIPPAR
jgi:serine protease Do